MSRSQALFQQALQVIPGGVNSPVRAFQAVGGNPIFIEHGEGPFLFDVDGHRYIDYVDSWGPLILGHAHPAVIAAVQASAAKGLSFGAATALEVELAEKICQLISNIESVRLVNSGTEATMTAIRLARGYTGRDKILKFEGCYHGHVDSLLVKAGSGALTFGAPTSAGLPVAFAQHTLVADFNDIDSVTRLFEQFGEEIAAIIIEPVAGNMGCVPPLPGFLAGLREICDRYQSLLIFDEVITGFRVALGGAQQRFQVKPDLTTLGKIIGGGMPVGAFGGRKEIMDCISPSGPVYQAGTLSGNPIATSAGLATLTEISKPEVYASLETTANHLITGIKNLAKTHHIPLQINRCGSMFSLFFNDTGPITNFVQVMQSNTDQFKLFFQNMLKNGIYLAPSAFESAFVSTAHNAQVIEQTLKAIDASFKAMTSASKLKHANTHLV